MSTVGEPTWIKAGVIWITGYSCSGKTTVARLVETTLRETGVPVLRLDGDDLRGILGNRPGYARGERTELAHVYFRLCSYLASQGVTVILSAVAMYDDVLDWMRANIPNSYQVYLDVGDEERARRDRHTKKLREVIFDPRELYDVPKSPDLQIQNFGDVTPQLAASEIVSAYLAKSVPQPLDHGKMAHWDGYYKKDVGELNPSPFARYVAAEVLGEHSRLLDVGCGNGRDSAYFASLGHDVVGIDPSSSAIGRCEAMREGSGATFLRGNVHAVQRLGLSAFDIIYSRFVLHAMTEDEELETLRCARTLLRRSEGHLLIECRSVNDPLAREGAVISSTERIHGHYRRFIVPAELLRRLEALRFRVVAWTESRGLAVHGNEDPVVLRVHAAKSES